jgi:hypothetical protein
VKLNLERFEFKGESIFNDFNRYVKSSRVVSLILDTFVAMSYLRA